MGTESKRGLSLGWRVGGQGGRVAGADLPGQCRRASREASEGPSLWPRVSASSLWKVGLSLLLILRVEQAPGASAMDTQGRT